MQAGALILGAGPAGLACAIRLAQRIQTHLDQGHKFPITVEDIFVLEKAEELGMHTLSGAVVDAGPLRTLFPGISLESIPSVTPTCTEKVQYLTKNAALNLPWIPQELDNQHNHVLSLGALVRWLGQQAEELGISLFTGFSAVSPLIEEGCLLGVVTDDKGLDKTGKPKNNFEAGYAIHSPLTVMAEGSRGSVSKQVIRELQLDAGCNPQSYALGVKEVWDIPAGRVHAGAVMHYFGHPIPSDMYGGGWMYALSETRVSLGLISGLQHLHPAYDAQRALQVFKQHPNIDKVLQGGTLVQYGAKTIPVGGYWAMPKGVFNGGLLIGDAGGYFNPQRIKGVHAALQSGIFAADALFESLLSGDSSAQGLSSFTAALDASALRREQWCARNHHQAMEQGIFKGIPHYLLQKLTGGRGMRDRYASAAGHLSYSKLGESSLADELASNAADKLNSVFYSGVRHEKDQPCHLQVLDTNVCISRCTQEYANPCQHFCPAGVYEMTADNDAQRLKVNAENCIHCKTCDIMDPYENITWQVPEGGGGPRYENM